MADENYPLPDGTVYITCYNNKAEPNRVYKNPDYLELKRTLVGIVREECSILNPTITVEIERVDFNYVFINEFSRYYFVTDVTFIRKNLWEISLGIDILQTYSSGLTNLYGFVDRNEYAFNSRIIDKKRVFEQGYDIRVDTVRNDLFIEQGDGADNAFFVLEGFYIDAGSPLNTTNGISEE